ncbi:MAG: uracil-DNA glycosylase [Chloroflexota bacterium]
MPTTGDPQPDSNAGSFINLVERVQSCRLCPRMEGRTRVLSHANGNLQARILFVAEAPGRLGADRSGVPLSGDQSGRNFAALLAAAGIERSSIFATNAVLCNPRDERGNNAPPNTRELRNCSAHLAATIDIVQPGYVVALGVAALKSLALVCPHEAILARDVGRAIEWNGRVLVPLYHPGPRALIHRPMSVQMADYVKLGQLAG